MYKQLICWCWSFVLITAPVLDNIARAQESVDYEIPKLSSLSSQWLSEGAILEIRLEATDNIEVSQVTIFFRLDTSKGYTEQRLIAASTGTIYTTRIDIGQSSAKELQYYVTASDQAGNSVIRGRDFSPLRIKLSGVQASIDLGSTQNNSDIQTSEDAIPAVEKRKIKTELKVVLWVLGLVAFAFAYDKNVTKNE